MRFITFEYFKASLLNLKKLLSLKADKSEVEKKANKSDVKHANLAQNNTREPDYVENRTHWIEEVETVIAEKQNVTTSADGSIFTGIINSLYGLNVGSNYIVEFNGKTYDCAGFVAVMQTNAEQEYSLKVTKTSLGTGILEFARDDSKLLHEGDILLISGLCYYVNNEPEMTDTKMYVSVNGNPYVRPKDTLYKVKDGTAFIGVTAIGSVNVLSSKEAEFPFLIFDTGYETRLVTKETGTYSVGYTRKTEKVHTIDTKYLPDDTQNSNPDWKQVSSNCASYIENKPFGDTTSRITITALNYGSGQLSEEISESATYSLIFRGELFSDCHFTNRNGDLGLYLEKYKLTLITVNGDKSKIRIRTARFDIEDLCISDIEIYKITGQKKIDSKFIPEIDLSKIKDMYYEEAGNVDAKGYTTYVPLQSTETAHGLTLPFETNQTWEITATNKYTSTVQQASDGTLYLGDPDISDPPFYITSTTSKANSGWMSMMGGISSCKIECLSNGNVIHTIDEKYFPSTIITDETLQDKLQNMHVLTKDNFTVKTSGYSVYHGNETTASGHSSHAEGWLSVSSGNYSHAEGVKTKASEHASHSEGYNTTASGEYSHAEGDSTTASNDASHAEGFNTVASGKSSHAEGRFTTASGLNSHAEGVHTVANTEDQYVQGTYNILDTEGSTTKKGKYAHIVGNGTSAKRSNAYTLDWDGNGWFAGDVYVGSTSGTNKDLGSKKLIKEGDDIIIQSSTEGSTKKFKITVDDNGTLSAAEVNT